MKKKNIIKVSCLLVLANKYYSDSRFLPNFVDVSDKLLTNKKYMPVMQEW